MRHHGHQPVLYKLTTFPGAVSAATTSAAANILWEGQCAGLGLQWVLKIPKVAICPSSLQQFYTQLRADIL